LTVTTCNAECGMRWQSEEVRPNHVQKSWMCTIDKPSHWTRRKNLDHQCTDKPWSHVNHFKVSRISSSVLTFLEREVDMTMHVLLALPRNYKSSIGASRDCNHNTKQIGKWKKTLTSYGETANNKNSDYIGKTPHLAQISITSNSLKCSPNSSRRMSFDRPWCGLQAHIPLAPLGPTPPPP
jgi:hypothetical protein